jgi:hypothetical protein
MKQILALFILLTFVCIACASAQQNQQLTKAQLLGTWKAKNLNTDETYYFYVYPNNRTFSHGRGWENWEKYTLGDKSYCAYDDKTGKKRIVLILLISMAKAWNTRHLLMVFTITLKKYRTNKSESQRRYLNQIQKK